VRSDGGEVASEIVSLATARFSASILSTKNWLNLVHRLLFSFAMRTQTLCPEFDNSLDIRQRTSSGAESVLEEGCWTDNGVDHVILPLQYELHQPTSSLL